MKFPEEYRKSFPLWESKHGDDFGCFVVPFESVHLRVICAPSDQRWQHVSVSLPHRCPNWKEMSFIKSLFWSDDCTVVQFHPKKSEYVNFHPYCLHLWRDTSRDIELPPSILVGPKVPSA